MTVAYRGATREDASALAELGELIDRDRMLALIDDWPVQSVFAPEEWLPRAAAIPRAIQAARFIDFVTGRNAP